MNNRTVHAPKGDYDLSQLLEKVDEKMEDLLIVEQAVALNQEATLLMSRRLAIQKQLFEKMLGELQVLIRALHALAVRHEPGSRVQ